MTLEQKVGQMVMTYFDGKKVNKKAKNLIREARVGGIIFYTWANDLSSAKKVQNLCSDLQNLSQKYNKLPLFIGVDQEGGVVTRLKKEFTFFPGNPTVGKTNNPVNARRIAKAIAEELKAVGINLNFAPVVDIYNNPSNEVMKKRSFGSCPKKVVEFAKESLQGYEEAKVFACLKHFPGHGDTNIDSHEAFPVVNKSLQELWQVELVPYIHLCEKAPFIMTAHIVFPQIDAENCSTFSSYFLQDLLRKKLGYKGIVITDSLMMGGAQAKGKNLLEICLKAIDAGNDILLIGGRVLQEDEKGGMEHVSEVIQVVKGVVRAVKEGRISEKRIEESVQRILALKQKLPKKTKKGKNLSFLKNKNHLQLANEILSK